MWCSLSRVQPNLSQPLCICPPSILLLSLSTRHSRSGKRRTDKVPEGEQVHCGKLRVPPHTHTHYILLAVEVVAVLSVANLLSSQHSCVGAVRRA